MELKQQLKDAHIKAMKEKDTLRKNLFSVLLGEIKNQEISGVESTDENVLLVIRKMEKTLLQVNTPESQLEIECIKPFLPSLMSEDKVREILTSLIDSGVSKNMGELMKNFNSQYKGKADNKIVSQVIKELL
jgi:uncharacterized protein YqeY